MNIGKIDKNFAIPKELGRDDIVFYDVRKPPFRVYGLYDYQNEKSFRRMPTNVAETVNEGVADLSRHTAGGRVCFRTSSPFVAIKADMPPAGCMSHMPLTGHAGFDLYVRQNGQCVFFRSFKPPETVMKGKGYVGLIGFEDLPSADTHEVIINFPLYAAVDSLYIGVQEGASLAEWDGYEPRKPMVFYGSSITQGGCASRPGNSYQGYLSRRFNMDYINLGFSGNAHAEETMAQYIASLDMSVFVYDYDHNTPSVEELRATHDRMFQIIRKAQPNLPVIFMSAPNLDTNLQYYSKRRAVVCETYKKALEAGDKNVYYVDGAHLFGGDCRDACTVDGCHPNDLGFYRMADAVGGVLQYIFATGKM